MRTSMTTSEETSLGDDLLPSATDVDSCAIFGLDQESDLDQTPLHCVVPLAQIEEFSEENGTSTEDDAASHLLGGHRRGFENADLSSPRSGLSDTTESEVNTVMNGPICRDSLIDMNSNGTSKYRQQTAEWEITTLEDLERIFLENAEDPFDPDEYYDFREFAEKYFNEHTIGIAHTGAISKTMNMVRRRSLNEVKPTEEMIRYDRCAVIPTSLLNVLEPEDTALACSIFKWALVDSLPNLTSLRICLTICVSVASCERSISKLELTSDQICQPRLRNLAILSIERELTEEMDTEQIIHDFSVMKDICKYMRGELKGDMSLQVLRGIVAHGLDRLELRDELYCQLIRQTNENSNFESCSKAWQIMCLCVASFNPSKTLKKYLVSYLRKYCDVETTVTKYAAYCLKHLSIRRETIRLYPPSNEEIETVCSLQPLVFRIFFFDGKTKAIAVDPLDTTVVALRRIQEKIGLEDIRGWALYESTPEHERCLMDGEYLADILSDWEAKQRSLGSSEEPSQKKCFSKIVSQQYGKLVFCKRIFKNATDIPNDEVEIHLLYSQAVHNVVQMDEYSVPLSVALHLAGLQAQVEYGDFDEEKLFRYLDLEEFLCARVHMGDYHLQRDWSYALAEAHKEYGRGRSVKECQLKYLSIISHLPLYGCSKIFAHYRGIWPYGNETLLALNYEGIKFISLQERTLVFDFYYAEIETIILEERHDEFYLTIQVKNYVAQSRQKCYMFEILELESIASLIESYSPQHASWLQDPSHSWRKKNFHIPEDWLKLYEDILSCRHLLVEHGIVQAPPPLEGGVLSRTTFSRLGVRTACGLNSRPVESIDTQGCYWSFTKMPFKTSIMNFETPELKDVAARMFNSTLVYTGIESTAVLEDVDLVVVMQTLISKCMDNSDLCNEFYMQLIKQTSETPPECAGKIGKRYWHLLTMSTCLMLPSNPAVFHYVILHLKRHAMRTHFEEGKYAAFCIKRLIRTYQGENRICAPSAKEIEFVLQRQLIEARVNLPDGHQMLVEFDSASNTDEMTQVVKAKVGMRLDSLGYGMFEVLDDKEVYLKPQEMICDVMYRWEKWAKTKTEPPKELCFLFKKRLFVDTYLNKNDPVEVDLLYYQSVTDVFEQKIPLTKSDAVKLCALRAQAEHGDFGHANHFDYSSVMRILPRHLRDLIQVAEISVIHKTLGGMPQLNANVSFIDVLKLWPLYGAAMYEIIQSHLDSIPRILWLAVSQIGIHLMEYKGQNVYYTYTYDEISDCSPTDEHINIVIGTDTQQPTLLFETSEASEIVQLVNDYIEALARPSNQSPEENVLEESDNS